MWAIETAFVELYENRECTYIYIRNYNKYWLGQLFLVNVANLIGRRGWGVFCILALIFLLDKLEN